MTCETRETPVLNVPALLDAIRRADFDAASELLAACSAGGPELVGLADGLMRRRRWSEAAWLLGQASGRGTAGEMKRLLCRNLAALQVHRPELYGQLAGLPASNTYGVSVTANGQPTILLKREDGSVASLSSGRDPLEAARSTLAQVQKAAPNGESIALCGVGDGYVLQLLAQNPPSLFMDTQQAVFVLEPEPQVLLHALMIHDFAGDNGPIEAERFRLFVGADWADSLDAAAKREPAIGMPAVMLQQGVGGKLIQDRVQASLRALIDRDNATKQEVEAYYATLTPAKLAALFGPNPPRRPRVMLLTTRFSTVLQYSTQHTAEAFRAMGWDAEVVIETQPSHRLYQHAIRSALARFKPDVLFQIDHLRYEHRDMFPANLPFVCWVQDHMPHLKTARSAASVTANDFVLTDAGPVYASSFGYPRRQLIGLLKLTKIAADVPPVEEGGHDLVFVSNASYVPEETLRARVNEYAGRPAGRDLLAAAGARLIDTYRAGDCVPTWIQLLDMTRSVRGELGLQVSDAELESLTAWLFHPLNDAMYRQQALAWVADAADEMGLDLAIYGKGWDQNPRFKAYARGPIAYGPDLERVTRSSKINLQIVPYLCLHQRLLDGLVAGGFYLIRRHDSDTQIGELLAFLHAHVGPAGVSGPTARAIVPADKLEQFDQLVAACRPSLATSDNDDAVEMARQWESMCLARHDQSVLPAFDRTSFGDAAEFRRLLQMYVADAEARKLVQSQQRASVVERFSYEMGIRRVMRQVGQLISETAATTASEAA